MTKKPLFLIGIGILLLFFAKIAKNMKRQP